MKVSRRSWHYRLYRFIRNVPRGPAYLNPFGKLDRIDYPTPPSVCPYAWAIFLGLIGVCVVTLVMLVVALPVAAGVAVWRGVRWLDSHLSPVWGVKRTWRRAAKPEKPAQEPKESLLLSYLKARKNRVCPPIELVD